MRIMLDTTILLMLAGMLAGVVMLGRMDDVDNSARDATRDATIRFRQQMKVQAALMQVSSRQSSFPDTVEPEWFKGDLPRNTLLPGGHPWVEIAGADEYELTHPKVKAVAGPETAGFWYNPQNGIVRARVPADISDERSLELYNYINDCALETLFVNQDEQEE